MSGLSSEVRNDSAKSGKPRRYGFNFLWMFSAAEDGSAAPGDIVIDERELDFAAGMGCNFVRIPLDYRFWIRDFRYGEPDMNMISRVDDCVRAVTSRGMHCSLNLHRAPGYCINGNERERHNLWLDGVARDAFVSQWEFFAGRYASIPADLLSFDLLNEPPEIGQYGMTRDSHEAIMRRTAAAIRAKSPQRPVVLDGLGGGNIAIPELADLGAVLSTRGYQPMPVTHYRASWCSETRGLPLPEYPGTRYAGKTWDRAALFEHYRPWRELSETGIEVHVGEFGVYNKVDNALALRWFSDVLSVFNELGWGFALWNFSGDFGIASHGRPGARWESMNGFRIDRDMYELFREHMI
ncbi:glycoside hydrolase family 5 protein [Treponema zuelzerae]|uniref:Glycoside hydrolase family 5 protein n=1 Tax=Teretinema zuelzerae TaxID=156 RepID=A0AAE3JJS6_9SPIR|nr:cellulase family glycosylhydrolase [Teretinema zuelzerae]MCD1655843.1 glycoside hydrolase family 5 protein [Teretinema zuelzerae]